MDLVNLMYKYINKQLPGVKLLESLREIDLKKYPKDEAKMIEKLIVDVEHILGTVPNEIDEEEKRRIENAERYMDMFDQMLNSDLDEDTKKKFAEKREELEKDKKLTRDGGKRFSSLFELLTQNELVNKYVEAMNDKELLEFITQYIYMPMPPKLTQEEFDNLVKVGIEEDDRESLWRLAFNYNKLGKDFSKIVEYFILKRDAYYLTELLSAVHEDLDIDELLDKVIETKDKDFFQDIVAHRGLEYLNEEQKKRALDIGNQ